ncbi:sugar transferase [Sphingomonas jatrophae]|uniref:Sugar transferase involved in LPS biosynthesis (Colanic, teichoic acid) n=1 Tax=Sphingomonas jatrophae TaxID=1166337 RepID=A0A1I6M5T2_9SPHN|nr:sugar transferase [Sphingomonas jatrophae]SFS10993.1 Sugar transferase involved in LPS biosynthesis (colanic, teichoic acid) [Sphingomonas jatrophae]
MKRRLRMRAYTALLIGDVLAMTLGFLISLWLMPAVLVDQQRLLTAALPIYLILSVRTYSASTLAHWRRGLLKAAVNLFVALMLTVFIAFLVKQAAPISRLSLALAFGASALLLAISRAAIGWWCAHVFGGMPLSRLLILDGVDMPCPAGVRVTSTPRVVRQDAIHPLALDRLAKQLGGVDQVFVACLPEHRAQWATVLKGSDVRAELLVPELDAVGVIGNKHFAGVATVLISAGGFKTRDRVLKRTVDLALVLPALVVLTPLLLTVAILVLLDSPGPILFVQKRVGLGNKLFDVYKFRSMRQELSDKDGNVSAGRDDMRVTRIGRIIRSTSIDELPQLFNILKGDMSFVGPRPHAMGSLAGDQLFWEVDERYHHRHVCKPGLTGLAQVRGFRGATHRREDLINRLDADLEYVNEWSIGRDILILLATLRVVVHRNAF